ncbi:DNA polymerase III subunit chi [Stakelama sp. CBK3Z-3]|uniref:DNA polymerase III subunit chi n=1 Tax=Stakelama flava TaxID=2860338 RepID=A0ABS6XL33_9SPHN|nr:DNA polymerase III subunit chi [Stakelama flava]MBW4330920.1 DNA polymerase III subunit chi [Stakelama flava]
MKVDFYHLTLSPVDRVLPRIAEKVLQTGERLLVVAAEPDRREALDKLLWSYSHVSFLPHARAGGAHDAQQPVLIAETVKAPNGATNIAIADNVWREGALQFARVFHFFDADNIAAARDAWKSLAGREDIERRYWQQTESGGWKQAA